MLVLMALFQTSTAFSQTAILNEKGDTTICFSVGQSKYLLKKVYEVEKYKSLDSICEQQRSLSDSVIKSKSKIIANQSSQIRNFEEMMDLKQHEVDKLAEVLASEKKATRRQKVYKWIAIVGGGGATAFLGFKYLTKP